MVGDGEVLRQALQRDAHAERRETALGLLMDPSCPITTTS
jgi:hypothetical protein